MTHPTPPNPSSGSPYADGTAPTDADARLLEQLDAALAPAAAPVELADAVLAATHDRLPVDAPLLAQLDESLAPAATPAGLADAVLDATRDRLPAMADTHADAPLLAQLDTALAPPAAPAGLVEATLAATRDHLPAAAPLGRIGFGGAGWMKFAAAAALVAIAAGSWWLGSAGEGPAANPTLAHQNVADPQAAPDPDANIPDLAIQAAAADDAESELDPEAARLLQRFDGPLAATATPDDPAAEPVGLLGERLAAAAADDGPWSGSGFDGIDRAIEWEVSFATTDDNAWLF